MSLGELPASINYRGYYKLENTNDSSGNGNNLTNFNSATFASGRFSNGLNGGTTGLNKGFGSATNIMSALKIPNCTVLCWVKFNSTSNASARAFVQIDTDGASTGSLSSLFYNITGGVLTVSYQQQLSTTTATATYTFPSLPSTKTWFSFIGVKTSAITVDLYLNGSFVATSTGLGTEISSGAAANRFSIGNNRAFSQQALAIIDEVIIEERAWTAEQIRRYYTQAKGRFQTIQ